MYWFVAFSISFWSFFTLPRTKFIQPEEVGFYEEYLGTREEQAAEQTRPDVDTETGESRRVPKRGPGQCSTIVCNHIGFLEIMALIASPLQPAFAARIEVSRMPVINKLTDALQSIYIDKSDVTQRTNALGILKKRAVQIEANGESWNPFCVFPEGTTTNSTAIMKFKRGAFESLRTVRPCYIEITKRWMHPSYDVLDFWEFVILVISGLCAY